jgi:hypothetical protein
MIGTWFRNPAENAIVLLEVCDSLEDAQALARMNALHVAEHDDAEFYYWIAVRDALLPEKGAQC